MSPHLSVQAINNTDFRFISPEDEHKIHLDAKDAFEALGLELHSFKVCTELLLLRECNGFFHYIRLIGTTDWLLRNIL